MRIRVTTRAYLFEERKREHIERGYRIEDERPIPVNRLCSFIAVRDLPVQDTLSALVAEAVTEIAGAGQIGRHPVSLKIRFRFDGKCILHSRYNPPRLAPSPLGGRSIGHHWNCIPASAHPRQVAMGPKASSALNARP